MERNEFASGAGAEGQSADAQGSTSDGAAGGMSSGISSGMSNSGSSAASASGSGNGSGSDSVADRARDMAGSAREKLADMGSSMRERAGNAKNSLADALESGADRLRQRAGAGSTPFAAQTSGGSMAIESDGRMAQVGGKVATGMEATANFLREADLDGVRTSIETQVKEHPGRTLLLAVGVGYLLGKALRK